MNDVEWRNLIRVTVGKLIHIADYLGVLNNNFDDEITIDEAIKKLEAYFRATLEVDIIGNETLPECPKCGEAGVFDYRTVYGFRFNCSSCNHVFGLTEKEYSELRKNDKS